MKHMLRCMSVALGLSLSVTMSGHAFSIGEIRVQSHLHTPLVAEVPLRMKPHERDQGFVVVIGDERDYRAEGVTRVPAVATLSPSIMMGPPDVIRILSTEPMDVPAFDLLLMVRTGKVTIVQNYPIALANAPRAAPLVANVEPSIKPAPPARTPPAATTAPDHVAERAASPAGAAWLANLPAQYGPILRGEVLYKVMKRLRVPEPYIWQVAVRVWEHNRDRFVRGNLHGLQIGVYLQIPGDLHTSLARLSPREAEQMVAAQWDTWQKPAKLVAASPAAKAAGVGRAAEPLPVQPPSEPPTVPESVVLSAASDIASPVNMATLESMLQGFEKRLAQRLSLPTVTAEATDEHAVTFVSMDDLQTAIQGLEARLTGQLGTEPPPAGAWQHRATSRQTPLRVGMETALASFLSTDSLVYVFMVQNAILLLIAAGAAWRWYRKRA